MSTFQQIPVLSLVWRPDHIKSSVVDMARDVGCRIILDLNDDNLDTLAPALLKADAGGDAVDLKISPELLLDSKLEALLEETGIWRIWVELHPLLLHRDIGEYVNRIMGLPEPIECFPIVGSPEFLSILLQEEPSVPNLVLKGGEASGFVSSETALMLYSSARGLIRGMQAPPNLLIWGGVATPEAAAAFLTTGAKGIVFESLHWLTDLVEIPEKLHQRIANLRPDHTDLTGLNLHAPCRLFNKGNSRAVRELKEFAGSLCGEEIRPEQQSFFVNRIKAEEVTALDSSLGPDEIVPLGVEAAFASSFVRRFGESTEGALRAFMAEIEARCSEAPSRAKAFQGSVVAEEMGTRYPFIQGAMSWITDVPEFAARVAAAGALPTLALGMMDPEILRSKLGAVHEVMGDHPFGVNVVALAENPFRDAQLAWIKETKPRFAVIAAGDPSHATDLMDEGIGVIYIAPNEELLRMAFEAGVRFVICEGNEAGGHVGEHTTLTLAQIVLDFKDRQPDLFRDRRVILAGGFHDRETGFMAAMLGADAVQMGTAYLTTREIVETGALVNLYQQLILESKDGGTVVTGESSGLRVRSLTTPRMEAICSLERDFASGSEDEASFRQKIEALSAGSLFIAARGMDKPGGEKLDENECLELGQFMSGACAAGLADVRNLEDLHKEMAEGTLEEGLPHEFRWGSADESRFVASEMDEVAAAGTPAIPSRRAYVSVAPERVAITGMAIVNSLGNSPAEVWHASVEGRSGIVEVPASKWDHSYFFHPRPRMPEKTYCKVGAFMAVDVSRKELGIPPQDFRTMTDSTRNTMWLAQTALNDSGLLDSGIPRERISVLISQNSGEAAATLEDVIVCGISRSIRDAVGRVVPLTQEVGAAVEQEVKAGRITIDDTTLLGRLNCTAGGFICNKYGFMGPSYSVSAACATALVALYSALQMIRNGIIDAAVVGGAEETLNPLHFLEFSALGALSGLSGTERPPSEASRPFDANRDGMVLGEGGAMIVIERESVAKARGARVHAYISSMGASNNHLGMVESSRITQELAIGSSFDDAEYGPEQVDLVECHATSTVQGDVEEVHALKKFFKENGRTMLASFKSQIGHTLGASGLNSLIRGVMAMKAGVYAPTLNYETPDPDMDLAGSSLVISAEPGEWIPKNSQPRRLQVNAFGFGGSNYVVQAEQATEHEDTVLVSPTDRELSTSVRSGERTLPDGIYHFQTRIGSELYRVGVVADCEEKALSAIGQTDPIGDAGSIGAKRIRSLARSGIHLGLEGKPAPPVAFVFPGQGSHYAGMGHELYDTFPVIRTWMDKAAEVAEFDLLHLLFHDREEDLQKTRWQQPALFTLEYAMVQYLWTLGVRPQAMAGHSLGELTALCLAGVYSFEDGFRIVNKRALCMDKACTMNVDPGIMIAVDAPLNVVEEKIRNYEKVYITNINSPHQVVIGGDSDTVRALGEELKEQGHRRTQLRVSMAFHSPIMSCIHDELDAFIAGVDFHAPQIPVISNTTKLPYPDDPVEIKRIVMAHLESPVHWMQNVRTLRNVHGVQLFVEVGPRDILSNLISDSVEDAECIQTCLPSAETMIYRTALAQLYASGNLDAGAPARFVSFPSPRGTVNQETEAQPPAALPAPSPATEHVGLEQIVQRAINSFVVESFGRFLKPGLLEAIRKEYDPRFSEASLDSLLLSMCPGVPLPESGTLPAPVPPLAGPAYTPAQPTPAVEPAPTVPAEEAAQPEAMDVGEAVIEIIMDATGYEREEIELDMDIREDLSIRSSRLPVIMDAMEDRFGIKIDLEDFMDARTIRDIAEKVSELVSDDDEQPAPGPSPNTKSVIQSVPQESPVEQDLPLKRVVFREIPVESGHATPRELDTLESMAIFSAVPGTGLREGVAKVFRRDYGLPIQSLCFLSGSNDTEDPDFDFRSPDVETAVEARRDEITSWSGMVFIVDDSLEKSLNGMEEISQLLAGFFALLKVFVDSPTKKFVFALHKTSETNGPGRVLAEGIVGMFLSAAQEYSSIQFRSVEIDDRTDMHEAIRKALDRSRSDVQTMWRDGEAFTREGRVEPLTFPPSRTVELGETDVVVMSGGGYGITGRLAQCLAPFGCRVVILGRTRMEGTIDYAQLAAAGNLGDEDLAVMASKSRPGISGSDLEAEAARIGKAVEIARTLDDLKSVGVEAEYMTCDVSDKEQVKSVMNEIVGWHEKIDGIIHGAGLLRDGFIKQMGYDDFRDVVDVKFLGAWNMFEAAQGAGLKFFSCLSSAAAIQGNPGQTNYAAGNRMMSALASHLRQHHESIQFKSISLPPIEGAGMAEDPEIRALMLRMNASYIHVDELTAQFSRELFLADALDVWVMFMRTLPEISTMRLDQTDYRLKPSQIRVGTMAFPNEEFPLIDSVSEIDLKDGSLRALRTFSQEKDLWIDDHRPFKFIRHPLVSAIMALEAFMEASRMLYPYLEVAGIRHAKFLDIIECPAGMERNSEILCRTVGANGSHRTCSAVMETWAIAPSGRTMDRKLTNYEAEIVLADQRESVPEDLPGFPVRPEELTTRPLSRAECLDWYDERSMMQGRYRLMDSVEGTGNGATAGRFTYTLIDDFAEPLKTQYQFSPYLLEALLQLVLFYIIMVDQEEKRSMIPYRIGEMLFTRKCEQGEQIRLEARMKREDAEGITWDARGCDRDGRTIMLVRDLNFRWFTAES